MIFFGSSAGGFSAIAFATHVMGSVAFAVNPQTNILRLHDVTQLSNALKSGFGTSNIGTLENMHKNRFILTEMFAAEGYNPRIKLWKNIYDSYHYKYHFLPFLEQLKLIEVSNPLSVELDSTPEVDHDPPGIGELLPYFNEVFSRLKADEDSAP